MPKNLRILNITDGYCLCAMMYCKLKFYNFFYKSECRQFIIIKIVMFITNNEITITLN